ncbi:hypothetical protein D3C87_1582820 [compost metagenome]
MKTASSLVTTMRVPCGRLADMALTAAFTPVEILSVLDCACRMTPRPTPCTPLDRSEVDSSSAPSITVATSRRRILSLIRRLEKSSGFVRLAVARTTMSCVELFSDPAGTSSAALASAVEISVTVRPRLASAA